MAGIEKAKSNATDLFHSHGKMDNEEVVGDQHVVSIHQVLKIWHQALVLLFTLMLYNYNLGGKI